MGKTYKGHERDLFKGRQHPKHKSGKKQWKEQKPADDYDPTDRDGLISTKEWDR